MSKPSIVLNFGQRNIVNPTHLLEISDARGKRLPSKLVTILTTVLEPLALIGEVVLDNGGELRVFAAHNAAYAAFVEQARKAIERRITPARVMNDGRIVALSSKQAITLTFVEAYHNTKGVDRAEIRPTRRKFDDLDESIVDGHFRDSGMIDYSNTQYMSDRSDPRVIIVPKGRGGSAFQNQVEAELKRWFDVTLSPTAPYSDWIS